MNLVFMQRLPASILGDIAIAKIWLQGFDYTHLGTRFALDRYIPITYQSKLRLAYLYTSLFIVFSGSLLLLTVAIITNFSNKIVIVFCLTGFTLAVFNVFKAYFRATSDMTQVNWLMFFLYLAPLTISVVTVLYSFSLFLWVYPIVFLTSLVFFLFKFTKGVINLKVGKNILSLVACRVYSASKMLFINSLVLYLFFIIDRLAVDWSLGRDSLGNYSVIMFVFASLFTVPSILAELIFPKVVRQVVNDKKVIFIKEMLIVFLLTLFSVVFANVVMYFIVVKYTEYGALLPLMQLASIGVIPYAFTSILHHVFNALDKRLTILKINIISLFLYALLLLFVYAFKDIYFFVLVKIISGLILLCVYSFALLKVKKVSLDYNV